MPDKEMRTCSLQEVLIIAWSQRLASQLPVVTRGCLLIVATLASSVLQLHRISFVLSGQCKTLCLHDDDSEVGPSSSNVFRGQSQAVRSGTFNLHL